MESSDEKRKRKNSPVVVNLFWRVDQILLKRSWVDRLVKIVFVLFLSHCIAKRIC